MKILLQCPSSRPPFDSLSLASSCIFEPNVQSPSSSCPIHLHLLLLILLSLLAHPILLTLLALFILFLLAPITLPLTTNVATAHSADPDNELLHCHGWKFYAAREGGRRVLLVVGKTGNLPVDKCTRSTVLALNLPGVVPSCAAFISVDDALFFGVLVVV